MIRRKPPKDFYENTLGVLREGNNLLEIINGILDFSRKELSGKPQLENQTISDELAEARFSAPGAHVLIVDDVPTNLKVAAGMASLFNVQIDTATSGEAAIAKVNNSVYDIMFMDHMMPGMDGIETTRKIREMGFKAVPVIALTANAADGLKEMFLARGFNDYLTKPIEFSCFSQLMAKYIPLNKQEVLNAGPETKAGNERPLKDLLADIPGLDVEDALARMGYMEDFYRTTVKNLNEREGESRKILSESLNRENPGFESFSLEAHSLKGLLAFIGAEGLSKEAGDLDIHARSRDGDYCRRNVNSFISGMAAMLEKINERL
jgi:CheY-like chemotaxis protein/HPt (histidine-containing phosphotransfer) domain-containing protein